MSAPDARADAAQSAPPPRADPAVVTSALQRAAAYGPFFEVDLPVSGRRLRSTPLADLYRPAGRFDLEELLDHHARRLRTTERRVAASLLFQGIAARLWSPVIGCAPAGVIPDLDPAHLHWWRASPLGLGTDQPTGWAVAGTAQHAELAASTVVHANLGPLAVALRGSVRIAGGLLWGNAASALVGAVTVADSAVTRALAVELLNREPLQGTTTTIPGKGPLTIRRRSCCLYYRVPDGGLCGDCALPAAPSASAG